MPLVTQALIRNIGGNASRSELDKLSEPLKKLIVQRVQAQAWLERALGDPSFPSSMVSVEEKALFVKKLIRYVPALPHCPGRRIRRATIGPR